MSIADRYWSFKLLLQDRQEKDEDTNNDQVGMSSTARPLLSGLGHGPATARQNSGGNLISEYGRFDSPELKAFAAASIKAHSIGAAEASPKPHPSPVFVAPTQKQLNALSVPELRRLRRDIARQIHPDLGDARLVEIDDDTMGRCNQMIDAAIKCKDRS
ncbi:MAG: hypothetical protein MJH08_09910 [Hyphomicrobiales bacterium]|nr:hypothetical protein [Hyphomicrobiales bacterium]